MGRRRLSIMVRLISKNLNNIVKLVGNKARMMMPNKSETLMKISLTHMKVKFQLV